MKLFGAFAAAVIAGFVPVSTERVESRVVADGPALVWSIETPSRSTPNVTNSEDDVEGRATALALASIGPADRAALLESMRHTTARLEAKLSPLALDLGDDDVEPMAEFRNELARLFPVLTAARGLARRDWGGGTMRVRIVKSCADATAVERCAPLSSPVSEGTAPGAPGERRARLLAWAAVHARTLHRRSATEAYACATELRARVGGANTSLGLVLTRVDFAPTPIEEGSERDELRDAARRLGRAMSANGLRDDDHLEAFARETDAERAAPWLSLTDSDVLVVPRMSALAWPGAVDKELGGVSACAQRH